MLIKELDLHGIELSPYVRLSASSTSSRALQVQDPKQQIQSQCHKSFASTIWQWSENALMILNQTFLAFCSKHVLPLRIKPFRQERIYQASLLLRLVKRYYLSHNVAPSKVQSKWPKVMAMLQHLTRNTYHSVQKAKSFNSIAIFCSSWKLSKYQCIKISCHREYFHWTLMGRRHRF